MPEEQSIPPNAQQGQSNVADQPKPELTGHAWVQRGMQLICQSCTFNHSTVILDDKGMPAVDWQLIGLKDDGTPVFRQIKS